MSRILTFALELLIVTLAVLIGAELASQFRIIPKALLHLPQIDFSADDTRTVLIAYLVACGLAFAANRLLNGGKVFADPRRLAKEIYALLTGIVAAALYLFFLTAITFSPELMLDASLVAFALFVLVYVLLGRFSGRLPRPGAFLRNLFSLLRSPWTWPILLFALSPVVVGRQFTTDRDFANWVTNIRVAANVGGDHPYELVNALGTTTYETPIMAQFASGDPSHIYVLTRNGKLYRSGYPDGSGTRLLLDLAGKVGYVEMENGALGFDLHPEFGRAGSPNAGFVYIYYTAYRVDGQTNHLTRYDMNAGDPAAVQASALTLIAQDRNNDGYHNAGSVEFGPDGFLYLTVGEASMPDCHQRVDCALVGGVLRLDVDRHGGDISRPVTKQPKKGRTANYFIPLDNPYAGDPSALGEFWAHGLRNPFRIAFDPANGQIWAGEVGSTIWEEVNRINRGGNYQFPFVEGRTSQAGFAHPATVKGTETPPVLTYRHTAFLRSVIGGTVYRGKLLLDLAGHYVFADNYSGEIMAIPADTAQVDKPAIVARAADVAQRGVTALIEAPDGQLLVVVMGDNDKPTGIIAKLVPADSDAARSQRDARAATEAATPALKLADGYDATTMAAAALPKSKLTAAQATSIYNVNCARCHGAGGKGDGPDSKALGTYVPDFTDPAFHKWRTDSEILAVLRGGGGAVGRSVAMPPWEGVLTDEDMLAMKDHVRALRRGTAE